MPGYPSTLVNRFGNGWTRFWFTPSDAVVLSLIRVLTGLVALWWYLGLYTDLQTWFGPGGLLPMEMVRQIRTDPDSSAERFAFSLLDFVGSASGLWLIYGLGLLAILLMIAGVFKRITTIAAFVFVLSFVQRAPMLSRAVDDILLMLMFYLCIGPSGACFSFDAWLRERRAKRQAAEIGGARSAVSLSSSATVAIRLMQVHLALIYAAMAMAQLREEAWWQGTAVWWMMAKSDSRLVDLTFLYRSLDGLGLGRAFEYLVNFCTHAIVLYEFSFAILIWNSLARPILLVLGVIIWTGLALISGAVSFAVLMMVANLAFLPPETLHSWCVRWRGRTAAVVA
jgi:hypothetical protein